MPSEPESYELLLVDPEEHAAQALREDFLRCSRPAPRWLRHLAEVDAQAPLGVDAVIFDLHPADLDRLRDCAELRRWQPLLPMIGLCEPGASLRQVQAWNERHHALDEILAKPLAAEALLRSIAPLVRERQRTGRTGSGAPVIVESAILFTDVRRSTALAASLPAPQLFEAINRSLSAQAKIVRKWRGSVIKFTGDGLMADFRGRGRSHFALRCALELQASLAHSGDLQIGIGAAEGLVMKGLIGEPGAQLFDVIGATAHLAARLCSAAAEGEVVITPRLVNSAGLPLPRKRVESVKLRGFDKLYECVFIPPPPGYGGFR